MNYNNWLRGGCGCGCNNGGRIKDPCNCDDILLDISTLYTNDDILQEEIDELSGIVETITGECDCDLSDYYTKEEIDSAIDTLENEIPSLSGYATEQWVEDKHYLTEHQPLKTINGQVISGTGNIVIEGSGTSVTVDDHLDSASTNPVENKVIVEALNGKLDASAYTPTDLSNYYSKTEIDNLINALTGQIASLTARLNVCCNCPISPTDLRYTGTTTGGTNVSLSCCTEGLCNELTAHDIVQTTDRTTNLATINVGECITVIGTNAFTGETNLTEVILPTTIIGIKDVMLNGCTSMQTLMLLGTTPPIFSGTQGSTALGLFLGYEPEEVIPTGFKIKVPSTAVNAYKTANIWSRYANYIEAI